MPRNVNTNSKSWPPRWLTEVSQEDLKRSIGLEVADFIETLCIQTKDTVAGKAGDPLILRDWQHELLNHLFALRPDGKFKHRNALVGMARKNGKSALSSGIALWGLFMGPKGGEVYSAAADGKQARIVFNDAKKMVEASPDLRDQCRVFRDVIEVPSTGSIYRVLSSEAFSKEGLSPTLVIYDELHAAPNDELYNVLQLGSGARENALLMAITTAGVRTDNNGQDSICYRLYNYGKKIVTKEIDDPTFFMSWWEAPIEADHRSPETWKLGNPGFNDINDIEDFESAVKRTPEAEFRTKRTNAWVSSKQAWLPAGTWDKLVESKDYKDKDIILGFDGSFSGDASVIVGVTVEEKPHVFLVRAWEKQPEDTDDWRVDIADVENTIIEWCRDYKVKEVACDPFRWQRSMQALAELGIPIVEWPSTSATRMVPACAKFYDSVTGENLSHDGNPLISRHISNAILKVDRLGPRIVKEHKSSSRKIDGAVASIIAYDRATAYRQQETVVPGFWSL